MHARTFSVWADAVGAGKSLPVGVAVAEIVLATDTMSVAVGGAGGGGIAEGRCQHNDGYELHC